MGGLACQHRASLTGRVPLLSCPMADAAESGRGILEFRHGRLEQFLCMYERARVVLEVRTHSRWISQAAQACCEEVLVANPCKLMFICQNDRKSDELGARAQARVGRLDTTLLAPIRYRSEGAQRDLAVLRARSGLVSARTELVSTLRGIVKSFGFGLPPLATDRIGHATLGLVPRRDQSGAVEEQLSITKAGDRMVRTLLVQCPRRILAKNAPDSDLRRSGERIASRGHRTVKRRAVIALSPQGVGTSRFGEESDEMIDRPMLSFSGTKDNQLGHDGTAQPAVRRLDAFRLVPPEDKLFLWLENTEPRAFAHILRG